MSDDLQNANGADVPQDDTIDAIRERYLGEWIVVRVTQPNPCGEPLRGIVLDHARYRKGIQPAVFKELEYAKQNNTRFYTFYGHKIVPRGQAWRLDLDDIIKRGSRLGRDRR